MKKIYITVLLFIALAFFVVSPSAPVYAYNADETVYITVSGDCYHTGDCYHLRSKIETTLYDAVMAGKRTCLDCKPPIPDFPYPTHAPTPTPRPTTSPESLSSTTGYSSSDGENDSGTQETKAYTGSGSRWVLIVGLALVFGLPALELVAVVFGFAVDFAKDLIRFRR